MSKKFMRVLGAYFLVDGLSTLIFGKKFVRLFRFGPRSSLYRRTIDWMLDWPSWQLRAAGAAEAALAVAVLGKAPVDVQTLYRNIAVGYALFDPGWRAWLYPQAHAAFDGAISGYLPPGGSVLDLGSGLGANLSRLLDMSLPFGSYTGVDLTRAMLERARERYGHVPNALFQRLDLMANSLPEGPFDLITATWVFEHLPDPVQVAQKAWERLKPGGHMILLFEVEAGSPLSRLAGWLYPFFSARLIREDEVRAMPGARSEQRFQGPLGELALVTIVKPA